MNSKNYLDPSVKTEGDQLVNEQIMDSYHCGVIDADTPNFRSQDKQDKA